MIDIPPAQCSRGSSPPHSSPTHGAKACHRVNPAARLDSGPAKDRAAIARRAAWRRLNLGVLGVHAYDIAPISRYAHPRSKAVVAPPTRPRKRKFCHTVPATFGTPFRLRANRDKAISRVSPCTITLRSSDMNGLIVSLPHTPLSAKTNTRCKLQMGQRARAGKNPCTSSA